MYAIFYPLDCATVLGRFNHLVLGIVSGMITIQESLTLFRVCRLCVITPHTS